MYKESQIHLPIFSQTTFMWLHVKIPPGVAWRGIGEEDKTSVPI